MVVITHEKGEKLEDKRENVDEMEQSEGKKSDKQEVSKDTNGSESGAKRIGSKKQESKKENGSDTQGTSKVNGSDNKEVYTGKGTVESEGNKRNDLNRQGDFEEKGAKEQAAEKAITVQEELQTFTSISPDCIWAFDNYTQNNHVEDKEKSMRYLDFIQKCIEVGEANIRFRQLREEGK